MIITRRQTPMPVAELSDLLDEEIALLELRRRHMEALRRALAERDEKGLGRLLAEMEEAQGIQESVDLRLRAMRGAIGAEMGCDAGDVRLSRLIDCLDGDDRLALEYRRQQIVLLIDGVRRAHLRAAILLSECARANRGLLNCLLGRGEALTTYGAEGSESWQDATGLVDTEF